MADVQESEDAMGDEVYQPQGPGDSEVLDDVGILDSEDTLLNRGVDPYDEGWSPPERPLGVDHTGVTAREQREGETLDERLAEEVPEDWDRAYEGDGVGDAADTDGELLDDEVGDRRAGRLVAPDEGTRPDEEKDLLARDEGFAGGAASAEEAAVHVVPDDDY
ncbi:hypothetical protein GCM10010387_37260 [Streptomyces inusitatus]|uniref:DUF5709 domain-containing protein n=1 Tax=Streptomyces inusitatus TaxID=68221 RepID=A0A918QC92_9ACTN|nr:DUF5709 domain-containing protein [Streptomyces inusitatus]GGZ39541.1 hypothetical protein GCM10010387_37260 [Streptomyces inusitatus]